MEQYLQRGYARAVVLIGFIAAFNELVTWWRVSRPVVQFHLTRHFVLRYAPAAS